MFLFLIGALDSRLNKYLEAGLATYKVAIRATLNGKNSGF